MTDIPDGYGLILGRGRDNAIAALTAAEAAGVNRQLVRTVEEGFLVPEAALVAYEHAQRAAHTAATPDSEAAGPVDEKPARKRATTKKSEPGK